MSRTWKADCSLLSASPLANPIKLHPLTSVRNSERPSCRWLDWKASARAAAMRASRSLRVFGGTESASFKDFTARIRCCIASSATLAEDTASRCDAASARIEWMRYSYCKESDCVLISECAAYVMRKAWYDCDPYLVCTNWKMRVCGDEEVMEKSHIRHSLVVC